MSQELQHLLDRIQSDAIADAKREADEILGAARKQADKLTKEAEEQARNLLSAADQDSAQYAERSKRALEQAARDTLIAVGNGIQQQLREMIKLEADQALDDSCVQSLLDKVAAASIAGGASGSVDVLLGREHGDALLAVIRERFRERLSDGMRITIDDTLDRGFRVSFRQANLYHDFSVDAIADALAQLLQPRLAEIVQRVAQESISSQDTPTQ